jgi:hypothetical protein
LRPSTERRPLRMHSLRPVPKTMTSYSSSIVFDLWSEWKGGLGFRSSLVKNQNQRKCLDLDLIWLSNSLSQNTFDCFYSVMMQCNLTTLVIIPFLIIFLFLLFSFFFHFFFTTFFKQKSCFSLSFPLGNFFLVTFWRSPFYFLREPFWMGYDVADVIAKYMSETRYDGSLWFFNFIVFIKLWWILSKKIKLWWIIWFWYIHCDIKYYGE